MFKGCLFYLKKRPKIPGAILESGLNETFGLPGVPVKSYFTPTNPPPFESLNKCPIKGILPGNELIIYAGITEPEIAKDDNDARPAKVIPNTVP